MNEDQKVVDIWERASRMILASKQMKDKSVLVAMLKRKRFIKLHPMPPKYLHYATPNLCNIQLNNVKGNTCPELISIFSWKHILWQSNRYFATECCTFEIQTSSLCDKHFIIF